MKMPIMKPRLEAGKEPIRMAIAFAWIIAPPTPWKVLNMIASNRFGAMLVSIAVNPEIKNPVK
tara:strand:- start:189 stop:377 length:189 start_codon:yes stop_codon:yes gene_type:complete